MAGAAARAEAGGFFIAFFIAGRSGAGYLARFPAAPTSAAVAGAAARAAGCFSAGGLVLVPRGDCTIAGARPCERGKTTAFVRKKVVGNAGVFASGPARGPLEAMPHGAGQPRRTWSPGFAAAPAAPESGANQRGGSHTYLAGPGALGK